MLVYKGTVNHPIVSFLDTSETRRNWAVRMSASKKKTIGRRIRAAREYASRQSHTTISPESLAAKLHWFPTRVWEIENGILGIDSVELNSIGQALGVHPGGFFDNRGWNTWQAISEMNESSLIFAKTIEEIDPRSRRALEKVFLRTAYEPLTID